MAVQGKLRRVLAAAMAAALGTSLAAGLAQAATVDLTFENIAPYPNDSDVAVMRYYDGGTSSNGATGPNYGVFFSANALVFCLNTLATSCSNSSRGGLGDPASQLAAVGFSLGDFFTMDVPAGFASTLTFTYSAVTDPATVKIFSDVDDGGTLLTSVDLPVTKGGCFDYSASFCPFVSFSIPFSGVARSVEFVPGAPGQIVLDDITIDTVPEPSTWTMILVGFAGLAFAARAARKRRFVAA